MRHARLRTIVALALGLLLPVGLMGCTVDDLGCKECDNNDKEKQCVAGYTCVIRPEGTCCEPVKKLELTAQSAQSLAVSVDAGAPATCPSGGAPAADSGGGALP